MDHGNPSVKEVESPKAKSGSLRIAVYSDDKTVREAIIKALGKRVSTQHPDHEIVEFATGPALKAYASGKKKVDLFILDGEAVPEGGMGIARQLKDELFNAPPALVITGRAQDAWLAGWSGAEAVVTHPIDPFTLAKTVANILV
jgi:CheY-like chemotaxis protein